MGTGQQVKVGRTLLFDQHPPTGRQLHRAVDELVQHHLQRFIGRRGPSVDVLFRSAALCAGRNVLAVILTGMGDDGARGMKLLHERGARTIAQNEETCVVFGMPKQATALGGVDEIRVLNQVARSILRFESRG